jgi:eukaryotic-like serine/threonine-protein kinase
MNECRNSISVVERVAALRGEQEGSWERGECLPVEAFLERHPVLRGSPQAVVELIYAEVLLRERRGETPQPVEYLNRFPQYADALRRSFAFHNAMRALL